VALSQERAAPGFHTFGPAEEKSVKHELNGRGVDRPALVKTADNEVVSAVKSALRQQDKSSWEVADGYAELVRRGWTQRRIAKEFGVSPATVSYYLACARRYPLGVHLGERRPTFWHAYDAAKNKPEFEAAPQGRFDLDEFLARHGIAQSPRPGDPDFDWDAYEEANDRWFEEHREESLKSRGVSSVEGLPSLEELAAEIRRLEMDRRRLRLEHAREIAAEVLEVRRLVDDGGWAACCEEAGLSLVQAGQYLEFGEMLRCETFADLSEEDQWREWVKICPEDGE
jgi:transcriptional regulator with XRE-family HTH domain